MTLLSQHRSSNFLQSGCPTKSIKTFQLAESTASLIVTILLKLVHANPNIITKGNRISLEITLILNNIKTY